MRVRSRARISQPSRLGTVHHYSILPFNIDFFASWGWRHGSVDKGLVVQVWGPEFRSWASTEKAGALEYSCNPRAGTGKTETGRSHRVSAQSVYLNRQASGSVTVTTSEKLRWDFLMQWGGSHEAMSLTEELWTIQGCWKGVTYYQWGCHQ